MEIIAKVIRRLVHYVRRAESAWWRNRFVWLERPYLKKLQIGEKVVFHVPVRSDGAGVLIIGNRNSFGYRGAHRLGSGEILLQPRGPEAEICIGEGNHFSNNVALVSNERVVIGNGCQIGEQVSILDSDFHEINPVNRNRSAGLTRPVTIGNNVWLGSRAVILKGVTIGDNSVIGAMSLVTKSIPANCVAAGHPAKVIRSIE